MLVEMIDKNPPIGKNGVTETPFFQIEDNLMITDFEDFCTWVFYRLDDVLKQTETLFNHPGPKPKCTDSELIAMSLIGESRGWHLDTERLRYWKEYQHLLLNIP